MKEVVLDATFLVLLVLIAWLASKIIERYLPPERINPWICVFIEKIGKWKHLLTRKSV